MKPKRPGPQRICAKCGGIHGLVMLGGKWVHKSCHESQFKPEGDPWKKRRNPRGSD